MLVLSQNPTIDIDAYTAGDAVGGLLTFDLGGYGARTINLHRAEILEDAASPVEGELELHLFTDSDIAVADDAAFSLTNTEYASGKYLGHITFSSYVATRAGGNAGAKVSIQDGLNRLLPLLKGKIYGQLVCTGTPNYNADDDLTVLMHFAEYA